MAEDLMKTRLYSGELGANWTQKFLSRHPELSSRWSRPLERERANNYTFETVSDWFNKFHITIIQYSIVKGDCYNMDEKGFNMGHLCKEKVICSKRNLDPRVKEPTNTDWTSLLECISDDGVNLPPFTIFKGKIQMEAWIHELQKNGKVCISQKGWTNNSLGLEWLKQVFHPRTKERQRGAWRLLVIDGHTSHITIEVIRFCQVNSLVLLCLPPHTTHKLQPLDVSVFSPLAKRYSRELSTKFRNTKAAMVEKADFI